MAKRLFLTGVSVHGRTLTLTTGSLSLSGHGSVTLPPSEAKAAYTRLADVLGSVGGDERVVFEFLTLTDHHAS